MKLSAKNVKTEPLPKGRSEAIIFDDDVPGFGLRIREGGSRTLIFQYRLGAKHRRMTLGSATAVDFADTRKTAEKLYARVKLGEDPAGEKADAKAKAARTFEAVADDYLPLKKLELRERSYPDVERHLLKHTKSLHRLQLAQITRTDIASCLAAVRKNSGAVTANRVRSTLSTFFAWAMGEGLVDANPVIGTNRNEEKSRIRVLIKVDDETGRIDATELKLILNALDDGDYGAVMKLLILTGQRAGEIAGLEWSEVDLTRSVISLPGERTKNHRQHTIPLSPAARAIIEARPRRIGRDGRPRKLVFGLGEGPFGGWSLCKQRLDEELTAAAGRPWPHWTPHDLRRTVATGMATIGIQPHIIEAVLNHVSGHKAGVAGVYNRASYEPEKRTALNLWADHVLAWVGDRESNVAVLRRA
jgi:integrase